jgi:hypothetical protein
MLTLCEYPLTFCAVLRHKKVIKRMARVLSPMGGGATPPNGTAVGGGGGGDRQKTPSSAGKVHEKNKLTITTSMTFQQSDGEEEEAGLGEGLINSNQSGTLKNEKVCGIAVHITAVLRMLKTRKKHDSHNLGLFESWSFCTCTCM